MKLKEWQLDLLIIVVGALLGYVLWRIAPHPTGWWEGTYCNQKGCIVVKEDVWDFAPATCKKSVTRRSGMLHPVFWMLTSSVNTYNLIHGTCRSGIYMFP
ncbi:hypothetical protein A2W32_03845 [candidate division WWE3 bacterium RBG_16_37_10]|uniref:Uncharacterized protein n=1 Tax=candidate division WWE3 bacterium RBG_16_37_10 TaxID=1802610 RepID=A0A1F4UYT3_UNCKA|nr:MAG: hypothetical protein A2W32_03845 [candidate division WWE3 bacterium RBG_16_37_10]